MPEPTPLTILGGYLGAGKTTLLNRLLRSNGGQRLALLINDFGAINIDAELISSRTDEQINLTNGCVCCGLSDGFDAAIEQLLERRPPPDRIIVEASGVADVVALAQYGYHPGMHLDGVIVVADAGTVRTKARDKYVAKTVIRQLEGADLIVLNRIDLVTQEQLATTARWLEDTAPRTPVVPAAYCDVPMSLLTGIHQGTRGESDNHVHASYATWHLTESAPLRRTAVDAFINALPPSVLRAKGFFSTDAGERYVYQQVGSRKSLELSDTTGPSELVVIGLSDELSVETLGQLAHILRDPDKELSDD